ncbi:MAG: hypothetical protein HOO96_43020 [Polyangiaceae bacterium]|nr:hypothetical protein [Polyangiaceae bacterium]
MAGIVSRRGIIAGPMNKENHQAERPATSPAVREDEIPVTKPSATESSRLGPSSGQPSKHAAQKVPQTSGE